MMGLSVTPWSTSFSSEAFSPERGGREGATRLLIVVTDGESHDGEELPLALAECEKRDITRYAIAVRGFIFRSSLLFLAG